MGSGSVAKLGWLAAHVTGTAPGGMYTFPSEHLRHVPDEAGHQGSSVVISGHQWSSWVIMGHHGSSGIIMGHQGSSGIIRNHQGSSGIIRGPIRAAETRTREATKRRREIFAAVGDAERVTTPRVRAHVGARCSALHLMREAVRGHRQWGHQWSSEELVPVTARFTSCRCSRPRYTLTQSSE